MALDIVQSGRNTSFQVPIDDRGTAISSLHPLWRLAQDPGWQWPANGPISTVSHNQFGKADSLRPYFKGKGPRCVLGSWSSMKKNGYRLLASKGKIYQVYLPPELEHVLTTQPASCWVILNKEARDSLFLLRREGGSKARNSWNQPFFHCCTAFAHGTVENFSILPSLFPWLSAPWSEPECLSSSATAFQQCTGPYGVW